MKILTSKELSKLIFLHVQKKLGREKLTDGQVISFLNKEKPIVSRNFMSSLRRSNKTVCEQTCLELCEILGFKLEQMPVYESRKKAVADFCKAKPTLSKKAMSGVALYELLMDFARKVSGDNNILQRDAAVVLQEHGVKIKQHTLSNLKHGVTRSVCETTAYEIACALKINVETIPVFQRKYIKKGKPKKAVAASVQVKRDFGVMKYF